MFYISVRNVSVSDNGGPQALELTKVYRAETGSAAGRMSSALLSLVGCSVTDKNSHLTLLKVSLATGEVRGRFFILYLPIEMGMFVYR